MVEDFDNLTKGLDELSHLNSDKHTLYIGVIHATGDRTVEYNQMIAEVQNNGATINPVNGKYLTIPMPIAGKRHAREIDGLFFHVSKNGTPTLAKLEHGQLVIYFILKLQVKIPARPFISLTQEKCLDVAQPILHDGIIDILLGDSTAGQVLEKVGKAITVLMKQQMAEMNTPKNARITQQNKGFNNPLFDTGALQRSIDWVVV
ncbi:hypothetical protein DY124_06155 [Apilactobacillus micheneri]|uniref:hypothetical protein n=1 Tax=Apilactobacillus micheneri TaxID=1899430 RepID=UPI00112DAE2E|nr:hypothetical protein [Apilactobacillus micheneri]TPR43157.1 hypothetical protein DY124_06155 [Apilactobacillus micheneri]TPR47245.1 hypothetical protein DY125_06650 [Apilactobacillus micheneri]